MPQAMTTATPLAVRDAAAVAAALPFERLVPALREAFASGAQVPMRHHHAIERPGEPTATLLLMPAWQERFLGVKLVNIFPGNAAQGLPALHSTYLLSDGRTGQPIALLDGNEITGRRTVATAALAASYLARPEASSLLLVGAGRIGSLTAAAMRAVRPIRRVTVWNPTPPRAVALVERLRREGFEAVLAGELRQAVEAADIVSCATLATEPLIRGEWLRPGVHLDLIGSFTPEMREADAEAIRRAKVFIDSPAALEESGDLIPLLREGVLRAEEVVTLAALCRGDHPGRTAADAITVFKAVGTALADLAAARLVAAAAL